MFEDDKQIAFQHHVDGTWGEFATSAGRVSYLLCKARLGKATTDKERRLTTLLRPVREVLEPTTLNFNQLLQRDLDDHRVATGLIPYLLSPEPTGPAFFPPIVAVLLPFEGDTPLPQYPKSVGVEYTEDGGARYETQTFGHSLQLKKLVNKDNSLHSIKLGRVSWNEEASKLVVIDGQHRAMALIAIDRTLRDKAWEGKGEKYRHFYESKIRELVKDKNVDLEKIEIPVTLCWFPDAIPGGIDAQRAARKLFVDVNKEAKQPSEARLVLLSDRELANVLTRALLNALRDEGSLLPLYAIEYDNPEVSAELPVRWTVLTNLSLLKSAVLYTVFAPKKYAIGMDLKISGRLPERDMDAAMRSRLRVKELFEEVVVDGDREIQTSTITNRRFPLSRIVDFEKEFMAGWGHAIISLFAELAPYAAHARALKSIADNWIKDNDVGGLAFEALFNGVGMFWTLRASAESYAKRAQQARAEKRPVPPKPEVVSVWEYIDGDKEGGPKPRFFGQRTQEYLGKGTKQALDDANAAFKVFNTQACQLGAVMTLSAVAEASGKTTGPVVAELAGALVAGWNVALNSTSSKGRDRRLAFVNGLLGEGNATGKKHYLNRIRRMDTPMWVYFRYFWLELLALPVAQEKWSSSVEIPKILALRDAARRAYLRHIEAEQLKAVQESNPNKPLLAQKKKAEEIERGELAKALLHWFDISGVDFEVWLNSVQEKSGVEEKVDNGDTAEAEVTPLPPDEISDKIEEDE